jgi:hypothetical protein
MICARCSSYMVKTDGDDHECYGCGHTWSTATTVPTFDAQATQEVREQVELPSPSTFDRIDKVYDLLVEIRDIACKPVGDLEEARFWLSDIEDRACKAFDEISELWDEFKD